MSLREQLDAIRRQHGVLTPAVVLAEARRPDHPLHDRFEWDDSVAAERWRKHQAHDLIVSVRIKRVDPQAGQREVRAFHCVRRDDGHVYLPAAEIVEDELATKMLLGDMEREWRQLYQRYREFAEFAEMVRRDVDAA